ncbi:TIM-barrel domain-containing protein [Cryobacterium sp. Y50]|uniref:glycoside hydrolase family 31 protein n=1 Tax=Cryobacterium sp. Y50 TaxID=2048286 RepID=UPI000CE3107C|nr:TIM-barrel domain-containing protein [Cryobacterium sp. Y50]
MIRHTPGGSGHPYSSDTDQREPFAPVAGEPLRLGVRASSDITAVSCTLGITAADGHRRLRQLNLSPTANSSRGRTVDGGHLASAQARLSRAHGGWSVLVEGLGAGDHIDYKFTGTSDTGMPGNTRSFGARVGAWRDAPGTVAVSGGAGNITPQNIRVFDDGERITRARFTLPLADTEHVTGFGERFDATEHRGKCLDSVVFEQYQSQGAERKTYLPMPFAHVIGGDGWGFHVRTSRRVWFDIGATEPDLLAVEVAVDTPSANATVVDLSLFSGAPTDVLSQFLAETGTAEELPDWVFSLWASGNEWNTQAEVERQVALHRKHRIPVGSVVIEAWSDESTFTAFRDSTYEVNEDGAPHRLADFSFAAEGAWPDPKGMVDTLHNEGVRVHLWQIPLVKLHPHPRGQASADARSAIGQNVVITQPDTAGATRPYRNRGWWFPLSLMPDLTDERAAKWWTEKRRYLVDEVGIDGFKTDGGEHAWGDELVYLDGRRGDEKNNLFPVHYAKAYGDLLRSSGKAPVTFSRAGFTGSQAHGAFWAGDENSTWEAFRWSMLAGLSAAASGIVYWGWDIAGFSGEIPDAELYLRAMAASAFVPIMQYHSEFNHHRKPSVDRTPWNIAERTGDERIIPVTRSIVELRERLRPYLAEQTRITIATGAPLMRPLYFDSPGDAEVWNYPLQWTLGNDLLVAPVVAPGVDRWSVYVPEGEWVDTRDGSAHGRGVVELEAPITSAVVLCRADAWAHGLREVFAG